MKLKIWRMENDKRVEVFKGEITEEEFQFIKDGKTTFMVQLDTSTQQKSKKEGKTETRTKSKPKKAIEPCPYCGRSFIAGRGLTRHLKSCVKKSQTPKKPKKQKLEAKKPEPKKSPAIKAQETSGEPQSKETKETKEAKQQTSQTS